MNKIEFYKIGKIIINKILDDDFGSYERGRACEIVEKQFKVGARNNFGKE